MTGLLDKGPGQKPKISEGPCVWLLHYLWERLNMSSILDSKMNQEWLIIYREKDSDKKIKRRK